jgi:hypothetical protein
MRLADGLGHPSCPSTLTTKDVELHKMQFVDSPQKLGPPLNNIIRRLLIYNTTLYEKSQ